MNHIASVTEREVYEQLAQARALPLPSRQDMLQRAPSVQQFWHTNKNLLRDAWQQWEDSEKAHLFVPDDSLFDPRLRQAVTQAWTQPNAELAVRSLWEEVAPGVFQSQFFDPERLADLRSYLDKAADAHIPLRPPYGIVLNRRGAMLDHRSEGFLAAPNFQAFYQELMDKYMRPIARLLFPEVMGYDTQTFGFSIQWQADMDTSLRLHTDASAVTLNINLNLLDETYTGSEVDFYDPKTGGINRLSFKPGTAMIHRGHVAHAAQPITSGTRSNFVFWLYGRHGQIPPHSDKGIVIDAHERWQVPSVEQDNSAPF